MQNSVSIPRIDRSGVDFSRMAVMVVRISTHGQKFFELLMAFGSLNGNYRVKDLGPFHGILNVEVKDAVKIKIRLREAAMLRIARSSRLEVLRNICQCNGKCTNDMRCNFFKERKRYSNYFHDKVVENKIKVKKKKIASYY